MRVRTWSTDPNQQEFLALFGQAQIRLRQDPYRVGLASEQLAQSYLEQVDPEHTEFWLVEDEDGSEQDADLGLLGRIAVSITRPHMTSRYNDQKVAAVGFFECDPARPIVARMLMECALRWAKKQGVSRLIGPMNLNAWLSYSFKTEESSVDHFCFEPVNPPEYPRWFETWGFKPIEHYYSQAVPCASTLSSTYSQYRAALAAGYTLRAIESGPRYMKDVNLLHQMSMKVFRENEFFEPISVSAFQELFLSPPGRSGLGLSRIAVNPMGEDVGFLLSFREKDYVVLRAIVLLPEEQDHGLEESLMHASVEAAQMLGIHKSISALVRATGPYEAGVGDAYSLWSHQYILYGKEVN